MALDYSAGTVAVVEGDDEVVGVGTSWLTAVVSGDHIGLTPTGSNLRDLYEIVVVDDTHIQLTRAYQGATAAAQAYSVMRDSASRDSTSANNKLLAELLTDYRDVITVGSVDQYLSFDKTNAIDIAGLVLSQGGTELIRLGLMGNNIFQVQYLVSATWTPTLSIDPISGYVGFGISAATVKADFVGSAAAAALWDNRTYLATRGGSLLLQGSNLDGVRTTFGSIRGSATDGTVGSEDAELIFANMVAGVLTDRMKLTSTGVTFIGAVAFSGGFTTTGDFSQTVNDGGALGDATHGWSDLFLASGAVINFANSNYTITHATGQVTFSGALIVTSTGTSTLTVGRQGATNPALQVDPSPASCVTGVKVTAQAVAGGVDLSAISSGTNEVLRINAKGNANLIVQSVGTGSFVVGTGMTVTPAGVVSGITTLAMGGALSGVTTLGLSGTLTGAAASFTSVTMAGALSGVTTLGLSGTLTGAAASFTSVTMAGVLSGVTTLAASGVASFSSTVVATSTTTGSGVFGGGIGVAGAVWIGGTLNVAGAVTGASASFTALVATGNTQIGGTSAVDRLHVSAVTSSVSSALLGLRLEDTTAGATAGVGPGITFAYNYGPGVVPFAGIKANKENSTSSNYSTKLSFYTTLSGQSSLQTVAMELSSTGVLSLPATTVSTSTATGALVVGGGVGIAGALYTASGTVTGSDERLKNIHLDGMKPLGIEFIRDIRTIEYSLKKNDKFDVRRQGISAQQVLSVLDGRPFHGITTDEDGMHYALYDEFIAPLINSVQDVDNRIEYLSAELSAAKQRIAVLEKGV